MSTNPFKALLGLLPADPLLVATVTAVHAGEGASTVTYPGGAQQRVRGTSVAAGGKVFIRGGAIEGSAPGLTDVEIEV